LTIVPVVVPIRAQTLQKSYASIGVSDLRTMSTDLKSLLQQAEDTRVEMIGQLETLDQLSGVPTFGDFDVQNEEPSKAIRQSSPKRLLLQPSRASYSQPCAVFAALVMDGSC
jgi:hypothetical protein